MIEPPTIGISLRYDPASERFFLQRQYSEAVESAGGIPVLIPLLPRLSFIREIAGELDGLLLPGSGSDVDPLRYGAEPSVQLGEVHPLKDETDALLIKETESRNTPLLAICFGLQIWNVCLGGTLVQDIEAEVPLAIKHQQEATRNRQSHSVNLAPNSVLADIAGSGRVFVNSHHHQAISRVAPGLYASAWSSDGLIEALEQRHPERFALGVQWHPEINHSDDQFASHLFLRFVSEARKYRKKKQSCAIGGKKVLEHVFP